MSTPILVMTHLPDAEAAQQLAQQLIKAEAAACVNQLAPCTSTYRWEGKIETVSEIPLLIKTTLAAYPRLQALIVAAHPYQLPEIIAFPITAGLPSYLAWVAEMTQDATQADSSK